MSRVRCIRRRGAPEARPRVRLLLRRGSRRRLRVSGAREISGPPHFSLRRDHPQPGRERAPSADGDLHPAGLGGASRPLCGCERRRRRHPSSVRRHVRGDGAPAREGVRARRHDVRQRAQRLEDGPPLRARWLHRRHSRQALPRGDARHGIAGAHARRRSVSVRPQRRRSADRLCVRQGSDHGGAPARPLRPCGRPRVRS